MSIADSATASARPGLSARVLSDDQTALDETARVAPLIAAGASARDQGRISPREQLDLLSATGLLSVTVPAEYGGADVGIGTLTEVVRRIAEADGSVSQIPQSHFVFLDLLRRLGTPAQQERYFGAVLGGARIANAQTERGTATIAEDLTTLRWDGDAYRLTGQKYYCTGALLADILAVRGVVDGGPVHAAKAVAFIDAGRAGVEIVDDWNAVGQRTTASGTTTFDDVVVAADEVVAYTTLFDAPSTYGARAQILHAAIDAGIARAALRAGVGAVEAARPWFEAGVDRAADDPLTVQQAGELELQVRAAEALLVEAVRRIEEAESAISDDSAAAASLAVAAAKASAARAAVAAGSEIFELGGTRAASDTLNLARLWRDARTHTLHDPVRWKIQHLGRWVLSGERPPRHGQL